MEDLQKMYDEGRYAELVQNVNVKSAIADLKLKAYSYQKLGEFEAAMEVWNYLIQADQKVGSYYNERGVCKFNLRFKHAIQDFDQAIHLEPDNAYFYSCRAYVKDKLGDSEGSVDDYNAAHALDKDDAIILNNLGLAEQKLGHTQKARKFFAQSDDLLGITTIDSESRDKVRDRSKPSINSKWIEVRKMLSSRKEFKKFLKEAFNIRF